MLAIFIGDLCLVVGLVVLMLPLVATELSRPRDGMWGAFILFLGLVLLIDGDRLRGSPMMAVLLGSLLVLRLGSEVAQSRWQQLSKEERNNFGSFRKWKISFSQLTSAIVRLESLPRETIKVWTNKNTMSVPRKKWVRPEPDEVQPADETRSASNNNTAQSFEICDDSPSDSLQQLDPE